MNDNSPNTNPPLQPLTSTASTASTTKPPKTAPYKIIIAALAVIVIALGITTRVLHFLFRQKRKMTSVI